MQFQGNEYTNSPPYDIPLQSAFLFTRPYCIGNVLKTSALTNCNFTDESTGNGHHLHVACVWDTSCDQKKKLKNKF